MTCPNCKAYKGLTLQHSTDDCPIKEHITCRKCCQTGHMTHLCQQNWTHWERPTTMEQLIPLHIRNRYKITSATPLTFNNPRNSSTAYELHPMNEFEMPFTYKEQCEFVEKHGIPVKKTTKAAERACKEAIRAWAKETGRRLFYMNGSQKFYCNVDGTTQPDSQSAAAN